MRARYATRSERVRAFPAAAAVGAAIVAACERLGEDPLEVMGSPKGSRALLCVADALSAAYPALFWPEISRLANVPSAHAQQLVITAHKRDWWADQGAFASRAAYLALRPRDVPSLWTETTPAPPPSPPPETAAQPAPVGEVPAKVKRCRSKPAASRAELVPPPPAPPPSSPAATLPPRTPEAAPEPRTACAPAGVGDHPEVATPIRRKVTGPVLAGSGCAPPYIEQARDPETPEDPLLATFRRSPPPGPCGRIDGPLPEAAAVVAPSSRCGTRTAGKPVPMAFKPDFDLQECANVRALRGAGVPWRHVHQQLGCKGTVDDLRRRHDPSHPLFGKAH